MSNSTLLRFEMYDRLCNSDRRGFLKGAATVLGGTAVTTLLKAQSQPSAGASAGMFDGFKNLESPDHGRNYQRRFERPRFARRNTR